MVAGLVVAWRGGRREQHGRRWLRGGLEGAAERMLAPPLAHRPIEAHSTLRSFVAQPILALYRKLKMSLFQLT
jgi:hypothetical protein